MSDGMDEKLERMQADGKITVDDADEVRNFASFLEGVQGIPARGPRTPEERKRFSEVYREHYPEDYARAVADKKARKASEGL
jgi:hypothetical protein